MPPKRRHFLVLKRRRLGGERFDPLVQPALVASGFVLVNDAFVYHAVDDRYGILVGCNCSVLVAGITGLDDILDFGAQKGAQTHIVLTGLFRLAGALPG
jgi:hypothetical protein